MIIGFTGTRHGMTRRQKYMLPWRILDINPTEFHHGDCVGADSEAHDAALFQGVSIVRHPPLNPRFRAFRSEGAEIKPAPYVARNHAIVDACDVLIAAPETAEEQVRSGSWATVRYARKVGKPVVVIAP